MAKHSTHAATRPTSSHTAAEIMTPPVTTVEIDGHVAAAVYLMRQHRANGLVVLDDPYHRHPVAILTEGEILKAFGDGKNLNEVRVRELASHHIPTIDQAAPIEEVARKMAYDGVSHLLVTDHDALVGMIQAADVIEMLASDTDQHSPSARSAPAHALSA
jgi:CBS domain-containing protein